MFRLSALLPIALAFGAVLLTGCAMQSVVPIAQANQSVAGTIHGGQQPIAGAAVSFYAASTTGYGSAPTSLLNTPGGYVLSGADGSFDLGSKFACPSGDAQTYLIASGGNTGAGTNSSAVLMASLGRCADLSASTYISINEVSTVAAVWSLQQFMAPGTVNVGTSAQNTLGLGNAFLQVSNLISVAGGTANQTTPEGNGVVPQAKINTLANDAAACINGVTGSAGCVALFAAATPAGGPAPTDTLTALLNIAQNPAANVAAVWDLGSSSAPFQPQLSAAPDDFTLSVQFSGGGMNVPYLLAVDGNGNIWVPNASGASASTGVLSEFSPTGVSLQGPSGLQLPNSGPVEALAIDTSNNVWLQGDDNLTTNSIFKLSNAGANLSGPGGFPWGSTFFSNNIAFDAQGSVFSLGGSANVSVLGKMSSTGVVDGMFPLANASNPLGLAIDHYGTILIAGEASGTVQKLAANKLLSGVQYAGGGLTYPESVAIDRNGNAWVANGGGALASEFDSAGNPISGSGFGPTGGASIVSVDGANSIWLAGLNNHLYHLDNTGAVISSPSGFSSQSSADSGAVPYGMALDASGNVWLSIFAGQYASQYPGSWLVEYIGVASPVPTPIAQQVQLSLLGVRP
jgi:streptogramin lyase